MLFCVYLGGSGKIFKVLGDMTFMIGLPEGTQKLGAVWELNLNERRGQRPCDYTIFGINSTICYL